MLKNVCHISIYFSQHQGPVRLLDLPYLDVFMQRGQPQLGLVNWSLMLVGCYDIRDK